MRSISALAVILASVLLLSAVELEYDTPPATLGAPPLSITETGRIAIPGKYKSITMQAYQSGRFFLGVPGYEGGLHCYSLPDYELLWTTSLGTYNHCKFDIDFEAAPYSYTFSPDGTILYAGVSARDNCPNFAMKLVAIDTATGEIISETATDEFFGLYYLDIDGLESLLAVGERCIRIYPAADLGNVILQLDEPYPDPGPEDEYEPLPTSISYSAYDQANHRLFCYLPITGMLARYDFTISDGNFLMGSERVFHGGDPADLALLEGEVAVLDFKTGELAFYDADSLEKTGVMQSLSHARITAVNKDLLCIYEYYYEDETHDENARIQIVDPGIGEVFFQDVPHAHFLEPSCLDGTQLVLVSKGVGTEMQQHDDTGSMYGSTVANGAIWLLDMETWEFTGECQFPEGCTHVCLNGDTGEFIMAQYNHTDLDGPNLQDELRIMRIEQP